MVTSPTFLAFDDWVADGLVEIENTAPRIRSDFKPPDDDLIQRQKRKQRRRERRLKRIITVGVGYAVMATMLYLIAVTKTAAPKIWDPYYILDISRVGVNNPGIWCYLLLTRWQSSSEQQIKKRYRDLSRTLHPDKAQPDESKNETIESINDHWVEVSKAFKALTDEEIRNNYIQYGHPDGKQGFSIGIALPKFIVTEGNGKYVLLVYGLLLGVLLPYSVGKWWYGTQRVTKEKVLLASASNLFREYKENMTDGDVLNALSSGKEYDEALSGNKADAGLGKVEQSISQEGVQGSTAAGLGPKDQEKLRSYDGVRRKAAALLWAYLGRVKLDDPGLDDGQYVSSSLYIDANIEPPEKYESAPLAHKLLDSFIAVTLAFGNTAPLLSAYRTSQHLIQAIPPSGSPLLQLPHITSAIARSIESSLSRNRLTVQQLMALPEYKRRKVCTDQPASKPCLSPTEYNSAMSLARQLPFLSIEKAIFKVMGERFITPGALVQFVVKARVIPPGSTNLPTINPSDLEDIDPDEGDLDAILGRKPSGRGRQAKVLDNSAVSSAADAEKPLLPPLAYAPFFPRDHSPRWHVFLADSKMGKIAVPPFTMTTFNKPLFNEKNGLPTFNVQTFKIQFQAPPQAGKYSFVMHVVCDSYVGSDSQMDVVLEVESAEKAEEMRNEEDEISEPEEDSLAGQMSALKSGQLAGAPTASKTRKKIEEAEESDDESGTEEEDEDTSETDTDTDEESPRHRWGGLGVGLSLKTLSTLNV
ncbi:MAG: hypothetical protein Q9217_002999 [Psora testacea]